MSGILCIAVWLVMLGCVAVWQILRFIRRKYPSKWFSWLEIAVPILFFPFAFVGAVHVLDAAFLKSGTNVTPQIANEALLTFDLPSTATEVDFQSSIFRGTIDEANFTIDEKDFLSWCQSEGWEMHEFYTDEQGFHWTEPSPPLKGDYVDVSPLQIDGEERKYIQIKNGYVYRKCEEENRDACIRITYDKDLHRAYIWRSRF